MAEGFKIAEGYILVTTVVDKDAVRKAGTDAGETFGEEVGKSSRRKLGDDPSPVVPEKVKESLKGDGKDGGDRFSTGFSSVLGGNLKDSLTRGMTFGLSGLGDMSAKLGSNPYVAGFAAALGVAIAVTAAPFLSATLVAGLGAGAFGGVMAAGIALVAKDPKVAAAAKDLKNAMLDMDTTDLEAKVKTAQDKLNSARQAGNAKAIDQAKQDLAKAQADLNSAMSFNEKNFSLKDAAKPLVNPLTESLNQMKSVFSTQIAPELAKSFAIVAPYLPKLTQAIADMIVKILPGFNKFLEKVGGPAMDALVKGLPQIGEAMGKFFDILSKDGSASSLALSDLIKWLTGVIIEVAYILDWTARAYVQVREFFVSIPEVISMTIQEIKKGWHAFTGFMSDIWKYLKSWPGAIGGFFTDMAGKVKSGLLAASTEIASWPGKVKDALLKVPGILKNGVVAAFDGLTTGIGFALGSIVREILALPSQLDSLRIKLWNAVVNVFIDLKDTITNLVSTAIDNNIAFWTSLPGRAWSALATLGDTMRSVFHAAVDIVTQAGSDLVNGFMNWLRGLPGQASGAAGGVKGAILGALSGAGSWLYNTGQDILRGIGQGIESMAGWVQSLVKRAAGNIIDGFRKALGISSPSKLAAEAVGKPVQQGIARGIEDNALMIRTAITNTTPDAVRGGIAGDQKPQPSGDGMLVTVPIVINLGEEQLTRTVTAVLQRNPTTVAAANIAGQRIRNYTQTGRS